MEYLFRKYTESLDALEEYHDVIHAHTPMQAFMKVYWKVEQIKLLWDTYNYLRRVRELEWLHSQILSNERTLKFMFVLSELRP